MKNKFHLERNKLSIMILVFLVLSFSASRNWAVTSKIVRHSSGADLLKGEAENTVISSRGTIQLGRAADVLVEEFEDAWSVNSIVVSGGTVYIGTSPNGGIYKYDLGKLTKIYPAEQPESEGERQSLGLSTGRLTVLTENVDEPSGINEPNDANEPGAETVEAEEPLTNEHIFAMATDVAGRLLAGISGDKCKLMRFETGQMETIFEPNDAKYIFAITTDYSGNIYLGTGPEGKIYGLDPFGKGPELIYDSRDKNILSLAIGQDSFVYAGCDSRGLIYKMNPRTKTATVLYDSDQPEITALLFAGTAGDGDLYATATSAEVVKAEEKFAGRSLPGRPESAEPGKDAGKSEGGRKLQIANTKKRAGGKSSQKQAPARKKAKPGQASYIYKITGDGYVTDIFSELAVFFCLAAQENTLFVGTGNNSQLFAVDPAAEQEQVVYEDEQASQITAVTAAGEDVYLGTANPAKLVKLAKSFASEGTYTSELVDAGQPAKWGKLQIEADIPEGCEVMVASRSGNVRDVNDPTFSDWTEPVEITEPIQLRCPLGRFCQYKLVLQSRNGQESPLVREIAVAHTIGNLAPKVESVSISRMEAADKTGVFKISYKAKDDNGDKLIYKIDFRKIPRTSWIELEDDVEAGSFEWDGKTVEDGRYEVRVTASDERSNTTATKLTGGRISEPVVVDNTGPVIKKASISTKKKTVTLKLKALDELSAIGRVYYTVDSNAEWKGAVPDDLVCDTMEEDFTVVIENLEVGEHIISVKAADDVGNTTYKTFEVSVNSE